ncbi:type IV pilus modification PilV family protein [Vibrio scophthalmi]|uniref:type IV pilus modification PilV family protein n=1 Tax=Vibrio scophthalmi TaxID=45658 RepID=UPI003EBF9C75
MKTSRGFTLIESIIVMVVMALAMVTITSFLLPQVSQSADPHYQSRAKALGQSLMTQVLARNFDQNSLELGGAIRCSASIDSGSLTCTSEADFGPDEVSSGVLETPSQFNDVDDFIGCWASDPVAGSSCDNDLYQLISSGNNSAYHNFQVKIAVAYSPNSSSVTFKKITLVVEAGAQAPIEFIAYRGNF